MFTLFGLVYWRIQLKWPFIEYHVAQPRGCVHNYNTVRGDPDRFYDADVGRRPEVRIDYLKRIPLTRPSSPDPRSGKKSRRMLNPQKGCSLMALPVELRLQIWKEALGGETIHLFHAPNDLKSLKKGRVRLVGSLHGDRASCRYRAGSCEYERRSGEIHLSRRLVSLLQTCKQIYIEAVDVLYSSNHFIWDSEVAEYLSSTMLPQRVNAIESVHMYWTRDNTMLGPLDLQYRDPVRGRQNALERRRARWSTIWHNIPKMANLRSLDLELRVQDGYWKWLSLEGAREVLDPLRAVQGLDSFTLTIYWPETIEVEDMNCSWAGSFEPKDRNPWVGLPCEVIKLPYSWHIF
ncbi:uncharacterized protein RAG0_11603 [Rhynchosporium agropyri]|uniref:DUF7730 domain-containing protein n=1 Tax=Rhynchosporium agropyri TaxID=914238 RepID=A0A1E1L519_9HELO|nr:uncharacterized protein RAG0_11603 [Rhynchosporium agropyri]